MTEAERVRDLIDRLPGKVGMVMAPFYLLMFGIRELFLVARLRRRGLVAQGTVVDNVRTGDSAYGPDLSPVIAFIDTAGNHVEFTPVARGNGLELATGSTVEVIYLPEASPDARVNTAAHLLVPGLLALVTGGLVLALALTLILAFTPGTFSVGTAVGRWLMPAILLAGGGGMFAAGIQEGRAVTRVRRRGLRTRGRVIDSMTSDKRTYYVVGFTDHRGQPVEFTRPASTRGQARTGRAVTVMYLPDQPAQARVASRAWWVPAAALILGGSAMLITAVGVVVSAISNPGGM